MSDFFTSTVQTYTTLAAQFAEVFESKINLPELEYFTSTLPKGASILDAGCGTARDAAYFADHDYKVLGIDLSSGLLEQAKRLHPHVKTKLMSLTKITLPDASYDGVWCKAALLHLDRQDIPAVLDHFYRILRPGGKLFLRVKEGHGIITRQVPFAKDHVRQFTLFTLDELSALTRSAGFAEIEADIVTGTKQSMAAFGDNRWVSVWAKKPV